MTDLLAEAREVLSRYRTSGVVDLGTWARAHLADLLDELEAQRARIAELEEQRSVARDMARLRGTRITELESEIDLLKGLLPE